MYSLVILLLRWQLGNIMGKRKTPKEHTEFTPSKNQINFLETYISSEETTFKGIAEESGVKRQAVYDWRKNPDFITWFNHEVAKAMEADLPDIWRDVKRRAKRNYNDSKLYLERFDKDYSEKKNINLEGNVNTQNEVLVSVVNITEDKKEVKE